MGEPPSVFGVIVDLRVPAIERIEMSTGVGRDVIFRVSRGNDPVAGLGDLKVVFGGGLKDLMPLPDPSDDGVEVVYGTSYVAGEWVVKFPAFNTAGKQRVRLVIDDDLWAAGDVKVSQSTSKVFDASTVVTLEQVVVEVQVACANEAHWGTYPPDWAGEMYGLWTQRFEAGVPSEISASIAGTVVPHWTGDPVAVVASGGGPVLLATVALGHRPIQDFYGRSLWSDDSGGTGELSVFVADGTGEMWVEDFSGSLSDSDLVRPQLGNLAWLFTRPT